MQAAIYFSGSLRVAILTAAGFSSFAQICSVCNVLSDGTSIAKKGLQS
jgi:hypothetical protein